MKKFKDKSPVKMNKFRLISEFVEESQTISKNPHNLNQYVSQVKRSREVVTFEPDFTHNIQTSYHEQGHFRKDFPFGSEVKQNQNNFAPKSLHQCDLRESFVKSDIDQTAYESLMNQFMGSYLEERLSNNKKRLPEFKYQSFGKLENTSYEAPYFRAPLVQATDDSPINKDSQITFSGSKQSRIINENQQSRVVKEEYFLLDQLKNSKNSKKSPIKQKTYVSYRPSPETSQSTGLFQEAYKLRAPNSPQKLKDSAQKGRQSSGKKSVNFSKQKAKVQTINLIEMAKKKSILKSGVIKTDQKYKISKQENSHCKQIQDPITIQVALGRQNDLTKTSLRNNSKSLTKSKSPNKSNPKSAKKIDMSNYLKTHKTFNVSSSKWKSEKNQGMSSHKVTDPQSQKKFIKIGKEKPQPLISLRTTKQQSNFQYIQKNYLPKNDKTTKSPSKYVYEYSYVMDDYNQTPQNLSLLNTYRQIHSNRMKTSRTQEKDYSIFNQEESDIQKDRQMIREIKKDLTKLINKISSTNKKHKN